MHVASKSLPKTLAAARAHQDHAYGRGRKGLRPSNSKIKIL
jgi:hypothetical protein